MTNSINLRHKMYTMFLILVLATGGVIFLFLKARLEEIANNGFVRTFHELKELSPVDTLDLKYNSYYIAGKGKTHLYLGNVVSPQYLLAVDVTSLDSQRLKLSLPKLINKGYWSINVRVDSPYYYIGDGAVPFIYRGRLDGSSEDRLLEQHAYFLDFMPLDSNSFGIRSISSTREGRLGKLTAHPFNIRFAPDLLKKQIDGILCTDGMIRYDRPTGRLVYLYRYRNQFLVMDTSLRIQYRGSTIDTNTVAKIEVSNVKTSHSITFAKPPLVVNKESCLDDQRLYVLSALAAENEKASDFKHASVIDVYDLKKGEYVFSFYIPEFDGQTPNHFEVFETCLLGQYHDKIVSYVLAR